VRAEALEDLMDQVNDLETTAVNDLRTAVFAQIENLEQATLRVNNKRALRLDRMKQKAQELSPERSAELQEGIRGKMRERRLSFMERMQTDRGRRSARGLIRAGSASLLTMAISRRTLTLRKRRRRSPTM
jgi:hypothetical protein